MPLLPEGRLRLPHASKAWIPTTPTNRLKDYVLNPDHPHGRHKAALFEAALALGQDDWEYLHDQIIERVRAFGWVREWNIRLVPDLHPTRQLGLRYEVHVPIGGHDGRSCTVLTGWRLDARLAPFLTTARPLR